MFSQFRQAVESLAQAPQSPEDARSQSPDPLRQSSAHLAENALVNLRKSIAAQRIAGPAQQNTSRPRSASPGPLSSTRTTGETGSRKTTLEERLRASLAAESSANSASKSPTSPSPIPKTAPIIQHTTSATILDTPRAALDSLASAPVAIPIQAEECGHSPPSSAPQESSDVARLPGVALPTDPQPDPTALTVDLMSADVQTQTDTTTDPCLDVTLAQEAQQVTNAEDQQHPVQQCSQTFEVAEVSTTDADPSRVERVNAKPETIVADKSNDASVEVLKERLKLVEQRFADVSTSFKKLQVERREIDSVITELTPLEGSKDVAALRDYLVNINMKIEFSQDELQRINGKLTRQEERLKELQDTHKREIASQSNQIERLRQQLSEAEALITASQSAVSQTEQNNNKRDSDIDIEHLRAEAAKANEIAKEEEEKRVKAISLLKTVRQKLVKAEKERDDTLRELNEAKDRGVEEKEKDRAERVNLERQVDMANAEREKAVAGLRAQFDKDIVAAKDRAERETQAIKQQFDADRNTQKTAYAAELSARKSRISALENTVVNLTGENKSFFEQLELRQAEFESSQCHAESLQAQNTELQFQLKESQERITLLSDEVGELRGEHEMRSQIPGISAEEVSQLVSSLETKYEAKLSELKRTLSTAEKEHTEAEATWSHKLTEKAKETDELKRTLHSSTQLRERDEDVTGTLKADIEKLQTETRSQQSRLYELQTHIDASMDAESALRRRLSETAVRADDSEKLVEESKFRETQLRTQNKTLRDELRKVQNSVAILERQHNPGATYRTSRSEASNSRTSISSVLDAPSLTSLPLAKNEEDISYEYLRNVILQFLEHKEMRPNLVRVLSTILHFTPQETRRLMSKV